MEERENEVVETGLRPISNTAIKDTDMDRVILARALISNINTGMFMTLNYLKQIRDMELYKDLGYESMEQLSNSGRLIFGWGTAKKFLVVADKLGTTDSVRQIADTGNLDVLVAIANEPELINGYNRENGIIKLADGSEMPLAELETKIVTQLREQIKAEESESSKTAKANAKRLTTENKNLAAQVELHKMTAEANNQEAAKWRETASQALGANIDIEKFALLNTKEGAIKTIVSATEMLTAQISLVNEIPDSIEPTIELIALANTFSASLKAIRERFLDVWNPYFFKEEISQE